MTEEKVKISGIAEGVVEKLKQLEEHKNISIKNTTMCEVKINEGCVQIGCNFYKFGFREFKHDFETMTHETIINNLYELIIYKIHHKQFYNPLTGKDIRYK